MKSLKKKNIDIAYLEKGILSGDPIILAQAITVIESQSEDDQRNAEELLEKILPKTGNSIRVGVTGVPGVGKSTFIEAIGKELTSHQKKVAVLAVDPSSRKTKGSILGDKTRMEELSKDPLAFIRPSATSGSLGGVTSATRDSILLCEAAGFDVVIVETVGVGQSEIEVRDMTDFFLLLMLAGAGDELQGIKKGIMEMADGIIIAKADGENINIAKKAQADFQHALHLFSIPSSGWTPSVVTSSSFTKEGIPETWSMIQNFITHTQANNFFYQQRIQQDVLAFRKSIEMLITKHYLGQSENFISSIEEKIKQKKLSSRRGSRMIVDEITKNHARNSDR